ncbi:MAG: YihY/virulence factor BrkB family protein [Rariglobus sp.]
MRKFHLPAWMMTWIKAAKNWSEDGAFAHSAAVSFYTLFSLAPVTIITLSIAGLFFGREAATEQFTAQIGQLVGENSAKMIQETVAESQPQDRGWLATGISIGVLVVGATTVFAQLQDALNRIWGVKAKPSRAGWLVLIMQRVISFAMVLTVGFLLLVSLLLTTALSTFVEYINARIPIPAILVQGVDVFVALGVITILFACVFKIMPDVHVRWRDVWRGAFVAAILFSVGRVVIALYLKYSDVASVYGAAGSLVGLLIWIYYSCAILLYGAEFTRAHREQNGLPVTPKSTAVLVRQEVVETSEAGELTTNRDKRD